MKEKSLSEVAYDRILHGIITYEFKPNEPIVENEMCELLNISRTPLREALKKLEAEGFIIKIKNRGALIRAYTQEDIIDNCDIRILFELYALEKGISLIKQSEIDAVRVLLERLSDVSPQEDFYQSDNELHNMIVRYCGNAKMKSVLNSLDTEMKAMQKISAQTPNRLLISKQEHLRILDAIEERNLELAEECLRTHLENVKDNCIQNFINLRARGELG